MDFLFFFNLLQGFLLCEKKLEPQRALTTGAPHPEGGTGREVNSMDDLECFNHCLDNGPRHRVGLRGVCAGSWISDRCGPLPAWDIP